jgi:hypothetical protein
MSYADDELNRQDDGKAPPLIPVGWLMTWLWRKLWGSKS